MNTQRSTLAGTSRSGDSHHLKKMGATLLAALILVPTGHIQAEEQTTTNAWTVVNRGGGQLYSVSFEGGPILSFKPLWTNVFTNDNFLMTRAAERVELPPFQMRDMTLPELARSIAFLSQGALTIEVVERNDSQPGNIWRVARPSPEALSHTMKMRAVAAPHLFASEDGVTRLLEAAEQAQRRLAANVVELQKEGNPNQWMWSQILPLKDQRVFVLVGSDDGISGFESLIKAAEQVAAGSVKEASSGK